MQKLKDRVWVDENIEKIIDQLLQKFDQDYHEFSSFEKWKKQIEKDYYAWNSVHETKFWQNCVNEFMRDSNLELIDREIQFLVRNENNNTIEMCVKKAVICFDLGEFARLFRNGRTYVTMKGGKTILQSLMTKPGITPDLKKEAITAYQKILMNNYSM